VRAKAGQDIRPVGCDLAAGQTVLQAGDRLDPGEIGLLAGAGAATVSVYGAPTVAILSSGDELVSPDSGAALGARKPLYR
jgi:molybdopterin biosynthesis enzyme